MLAEDLLEILGARSRFRLLRALARRPQTLGELARAAAISNQATLKHIRVLEKGALVEPLSLASPGGGGRLLYRLRAPVMLEMEVEDELLRIWALVARQAPASAGQSERSAAKATVGQLLELEDEARSLQRGIRAASDRMARLFRLLRDIRSTQEEMVGHMGLDRAGELLLQTYLERGDESLMETTAQQLGLDARVLEGVRRLVRQGARK